ncbi:hypothetical protein DSECCO2_145900 [anaerobic digester metagenome]|jgi:hypothetical protein
MDSFTNLPLNTSYWLVSFEYKLLANSLTNIPLTNHFLTWSFIDDKDPDQVHSYDLGI